MQGMRDLMRGSLARSLSTLRPEDRLAAALPLVCGTALASHCEVGRLDGERTLHLRVRGRAWLHPLLSMREVLRSDLARVSGVAVDGLRFDVSSGDVLSSDFLSGADGGSTPAMQGKKGLR